MDNEQAKQKDKRNLIAIWVMVSVGVLTVIGLTWFLFE